MLLKELEGLQNAQRLIDASAHRQIVAQTVAHLPVGVNQEQTSGLWGEKIFFQKLREQTSGLWGKKIFFENFEAPQPVVIISNAQQGVQTQTLQKTPRICEKMFQKLPNYNEPPSQLYTILYISVPSKKNSKKTHT